MDNKQQKETLMSHEVLSRPWAKVGTDHLCPCLCLTVKTMSSLWTISQTFGK